MQVSSTKDDASPAASAAVDASVVPEQSQAAESLPAEVKGEPESLLDAVKAALKKDEPAQESPPAADGQGKPADASAAEADDGGELGDVTPEELNRYHSKTRRRVQGLLAERDTLRKDLDDLRPRAEQFDRIVQYVEKAGLTSQEVDAGFEIMRLMKAEPAKALAALMPYVEQLQTLTGDRLPADLAEAVESGRITEVHARELASHRSRSSLADEQSRRAAEVARQKAAAEQAERQATAIREMTAGALTEWARHHLERDPDQGAKAPLIESEIRAQMVQAHAEGKPPRTAQEIFALASRAKAIVEQRLAALLPTPRAVQPVPSGAGAQGPAEPKTAAEAAVLALRAMR